MVIFFLPNYHGFAGEHPHRHLKEFYVICSIVRSHNAPKDYIKMKTFPFSLVDTIKDWLYFNPVQLE